MEILNRHGENISSFGSFSFLMSHEIIDAKKPPPASFVPLLVIHTSHSQSNS